MTRSPHRHRHVDLHQLRHNNQVDPPPTDRFNDIVPSLAAYPSHGTPTTNEQDGVLDRRVYSHVPDPGEDPSSVGGGGGGTPKCTGSAQMCELPESNTKTETLPIVLGVVIPISVAAVLLLFLHRRLVKKRRIEDANDKYRSLDFGLGESQTFGGKRIGLKGGKKNGPEMSTLSLNASTLHGRGVSLDIDSPYVLPESRPSFHSSHDDGDPYRPITTFSRSGTNSRANSPNMRPSPSLRGDLEKPGSSDDHLSPSTTYASSAGLLPNAQRSPLSSPINTSENEKGGNFLDSPSVLEVPSPVLTKNTGVVTRKPVAAPQPVELPDSVPVAVEMLHSTDNTRPPSPTTHTPSSASPTRQSNASTVPTSHDSHNEKQRVHSSQAQIVVEQFDENEVTYADILGIVQKESFSPTLDQDEFGHVPTIHEPDGNSSGLGVQNVRFDDRRLSVRPLPPDNPEDNAEQRANRIRSFYKEYFQGDGGDEEYDQYDYYEDYDQEFLSGATIWDPETGQFIIAERPYAEPVTRRAMTPPPRAPPRFRGGPRPGHNSGGSMPGSRLRAYSSASNRPGPRGRPKKKLPPPQALTSLPTPSMLKNDSALFTALDFAPPQTLRDRAAGMRPDSPFGSKKPYAPSVRAHTPLASPFSELSAMPSPHMLRKSGTFTALDFAPPPRFKNDTGSDKGSIRSGGSNVSRLQLHNIRTGAYRVSRLPPEAVGTKEDLVASLRPKWDLRR